MLKLLFNSFKICSILKKIHITSICKFDCWLQSYQKMKRIWKRKNTHPALSSANYNHFISMIKKTVKNPILMT